MAAHIAVGRYVAVAHRGADTKPTAGQALNPVQGEVADVDQQFGPGHPPARNTASAAAAAWW
jgi:hypothetical protein